MSTKHKALSGSKLTNKAYVANEWKKLSTKYINTSNVNMFKNKVDTYLRRAGYT